MKRGKFPALDGLIILCLSSVLITGVVNSGSVKSIKGVQYRQKYQYGSFFDKEIAS